MYVHILYTEKEVMCHCLYFFHPLSHFTVTSIYPPSRVTSHYHQPSFILTMILRQTSALISERERETNREGGEGQTWEYTEEATKWTTNHPLISMTWKTCFPSASKHNYASEHALRKSFNNKSSPSLIMPNISR